MTDLNFSLPINSLSVHNHTISHRDRECHKKRLVWMFITSSILVFFGMLILILLYRGILIILDFRNKSIFMSINQSRNIVKRQPKVHTKKKSYYRSWKSVFRDWFTELVAAQTTFGTYFKSFIFLVSMVSLTLYFVDAKQSVVETCNVWEDYVTFKIDLPLNILLFIYFISRMIASLDRLWFLFELHSVVDFLTLPPFFLALYLNRSWIGFRSFRAFRLMSFPDILDYFSILKRPAHIRLTQLCCIFIAVWIAAAGVVHLLENSGDPPNFDNAQPMSYYICFYFVLITMSTVGYGDFTCKTTCGRIFIILFILVGLALFASCIPEIIDLIGSKPKYAGILQLEKGRKHIILCGHISYQSVLNILRDFIHEDREDEVHIVILHRIEPELPLQSLLKRNYPMLLYFKGSMTNYYDLERVKLHEAEACLILADKYAIDPDAEDAANIMRVISIKNYVTDIRVMVQLMLYRNKAYILNIPSFNRLKGDQVICLSELKLAFFAQSCVAPGFSTMLANLVAMRSFKKSLVQMKWSYPYLRGTAMGLHTEMFSRSFVGMSFQECAVLCFTKLKILLVGIELKDKEKTVKVNPLDHRILEYGLGFFIAQSSDETERAWNYCSVCHADVKDEKLIVKYWVNEYTDDPAYYNSSPVESIGSPKLKSSPKLDRKSSIRAKVKDEFHKSNGSLTSLPESFYNVSEIESSTKSVKSATSSDFEQTGFDSTGMFHWVQAKTFEDSILDRELDKIHFFKGHVIVCIFAEPTSPVYGLRNLVLPLRASNFHYNELKDIVIIGCIEYLKREWLWCQNLPKIYLLNGSPLNRADLRAVNIHLCDMCCIVSAKSFNNEDPVLNDKEPILATLNIKSMGYKKEIYDLAMDRSLSLKSISTVIVDTGGSSMNNIHIPILTELYNDNNVVFLDEYEDNPDIELYLSQSFACGTAFAVSVLDVLMSMTYFNYKCLRLVRSLINNGASRELEWTTAEGTALNKGDNSPELLNNRNRCRINQISLSKTPLYKYSQYGTYGDLFVAAIKNYNMLCLGLYRYRDIEEEIDQFSDKRFVITNPPTDFILEPSDKVFVLMQFNTNLEMSSNE